MGRRVPLAPISRWLWRVVGTHVVASALCDRGLRGANYDKIKITPSEKPVGLRVSRDSGRPVGSGASPGPIQRGRAF